MFCDLSSNHSMKRTRLASIGVLKPCSWDFNSNMHSFDFLACFFSPPFSRTAFYFLTCLTARKQHLPCLQLQCTHMHSPTPPFLSDCLSGEGVWQQQQVRYKITGEAGAIIPPADAGTFMRRVTVNDSVVVSPEAGAAQGHRLLLSAWLPALLRVGLCFLTCLTGSEGLLSMTDLVLVLLTYRHHVWPSPLPWPFQLTPWPKPKPNSKNSLKTESYTLKQAFGVEKTSQNVITSQKIHWLCK